MSQNELSREEIERNQDALRFKSDILQKETNAIWKLTTMRENWMIYFCNGSSVVPPVIPVEVKGSVVNIQFALEKLVDRGCFLMVVRPIDVPSTIKSLHGTFLMEMLDKDGNAWHSETLGCCNWLREEGEVDDIDNLYFSEIYIPETRLVSDEVLGETDSLTIRLKFIKSYARTLEFPNAVELQKEASAAVDPIMNSHMEALFNDKSNNADVQLKINDGTVIPAHKLILSARSPVFRTMFEGNFIEKLGTVEIPDISSATMNILLYHIYTGKLHSDWKNNVAEVLIGANKYDLQGIVQYCDYLMITLCTDFNAEDLLAIAKLHSLERATGDIEKYIKGITI